MYNIQIRPLKEEDAKTSYIWRNDPEIWRYTRSRPNHTVTYEIEKNWIRQVLLDDTCRRFAIIVDDIYIGNIQLTNIRNGAAEYHIFIGDKSYLGKGISSLVTYQLLHFAKEELKLNEVYLSVHKENISAFKSYIRNSFQKISEKDGWIKMSNNLKKLPPPVVSIFVMVYNHAKFLKDCLDGLLMQQCNFTYNIVVGEDFSLDHSREILMNYKERFPGKFKLLLHPRNIGATHNQIAVLENCNGNYIAMCEGDDYWTDPYKLQKQVDFLEANKEYVLTHHDTIIIDENNNILKQSKLPLLYKNDFSNAELQKGISLPTLTLCFRNVFYNKSVKFPHVVNGDYALVSLLGLFGKAKYINDIQNACYRIHTGGIWSKTSKNKKNKAKYETLKGMSTFYFDNGNKDLALHFREKLSEHFKILILNLVKRKEYTEAMIYSKRYYVYYFKTIISNLNLAGNFKKIKN